MKKTIAIVLSAALLLCFASCSEGTETTSSEMVSSEEVASEMLSEAEITSETTSDTASEVIVDTTGDATTANITIRDVDDDGVIRVACVGDSITGGNPGSNYPEFLANFLAYQSTVDGKTYDVKNHGKGGAAVRHYLENLEGSYAQNLRGKTPGADGKVEAYFWYDSEQYQSSFDYMPDVVIVQMGTNDSLGGNWDAFDTYFKSDYYEYLIKPYQEKGCQVIISTSPYSYQYTNINEKIRDTIIAIATEHNCPIVDTNTLMYGLMEMFDGVHCTQTGYRFMAENFYKFIFGGALMDVTITTSPGATITFTNKTTGAVDVRMADNTGKTVMSYVPGDYELSFDIICEGRKASLKNELTVSADKNNSLTVNLEEGDFVVSRGATVTCSGEDIERGMLASKIVDGDISSDGSRWECLEDETAPWVELDMGNVYVIDAIRCYWEAAHASKYTIKISENGTDWESFKVTDGHEGMVRTNLGSEKNARYIRIECEEKGNSKYRYSLYEVEALSQNRP